MSKALANTGQFQNSLPASITYLVLYMTLVEKFGIHSNQFVQAGQVDIIDENALVDGDHVGDHLGLHE